MSSVTPLLDTLVHQVAKQSDAVQKVPRGTTPVAPLTATAAVTEFSQTGEQFARILKWIDHLQVQLMNNPSSNAKATATQQSALFSESSALSAAALKRAVQAKIQTSGLFYEAKLKLWHHQQLPISAIRRQPQNSEPSLRQELVHRQLEMVQTGVLRFDFDLTPQLHLLGLIQPDVHPLLQRRQQQSAEPQSEAGNEQGWTCEFKLSHRQRGELRVRLRMENQRLFVELQGGPTWLTSLRSQSESFQSYMKNTHDIAIAALTFRTVEEADG